MGVLLGNWMDDLMERVLKSLMDHQLAMALGTEWANVLDCWLS